ncbi:EamA family transporter [Nakamurella sp. YIM 132087]|uniref:EamA family transporter n=1 Tax=Nakamurella alba TaxID=2665158 RepID=A0A7K1FJR4_9ACTN|nr:EamA family transporter [Nakamurella alba]MTD14372.1 EamA family transporter [Nakamurella alba]
MKLRDTLLAVLVALIWGANFVVIDEGLDGIPPLLFVAIRFVVVLIPAVFLVRRPQVPFRIIAAAGLLTCVGQFGLLYTALKLGMPAGIASLVLQAQVMFTVLFAALALRERPTVRQFIGITVGGIGLVLVGVGRSAGTPLLALMLTLAAAVAWASGNIVTRKAGVTSGLAFTVWTATVVPVPMFALSLVVDGPSTVWHALGNLGVGALLSTAYTAYLASLVGYGIWNSLLARYPAASVVPFTLLVPAVGMLTAWLVQDEVPEVVELIGGVVVLVGVAVTAFARRRRSAAEPTFLPVDPGRAATTRSG